MSERTRLDDVLAALPGGAAALLKGAYLARQEQRAAEEAEQQERTRARWLSLARTAREAHPRELPALALDSVPPEGWVGTETSWPITVELPGLAPLRRVFDWDGQRWVARDGWTVFLPGCAPGKPLPLAEVLLRAFDLAGPTDKDVGF